MLGARVLEALQVIAVRAFASTGAAWALAPIGAAWALAPIGAPEPRPLTTGKPRPATIPTPADKSGKP